MTTFNLMGIKECLEIAQIVVTVLAIIVGALWSYWLFVRNRQRYPRAVLRHDVTCKPIRDGRTYLRVDVSVENLGSILISLTSMETRIQQVFSLCGSIRDSLARGEDPVPKKDTEIQWPI